MRDESMENRSVPFKHCFETTDHPHMQYISEAISILALTISALSVIENRRNNRIGQSAEVRGHSIEDPAGFSYEIQNKGKGPAYFTKVEYFLDQKPLQGISLRDTLAKVLSQAGISYKLSVTHPAQGGVMQAGETIQLVKISVSLEDAAKLKAIPSERFGVRITYRSAHGKTREWSTDDQLLTSRH